MNTGDINFAGVGMFENPRPSADDTAFEMKYNQSRQYATATSGTYRNVIDLPDGPGRLMSYRPFDKEDGVLYFDDGSKTSVEDGVERFGFSDAKVERMSDWSDDHRLKVSIAKAVERKKRAEAEQERRKKQREEERRNKKLVGSAKQKLTAEEWTAVENHFADIYYS